MFVCVARLVLEIPASGSLKAKRQVLRRITDRVKARFNVAVAEVEDNDLWQRATLALSVVANDKRHVNEQMDKIIHFVEEMYVAPLISREMEILSFGEQLFGSRTNSQASFRPGSDLPAIPLIDKGERSLAEAEGLGEWEERHEQPEHTPPPAIRGRQGPPGQKRTMPVDDAKARARGLRNPRDWEKP